MSALDPQPQPSASTDCAPAADAPAAQRIEAPVMKLGDGLQVRRALPTRLRRTIGAWCFFDHFGPADVEQGRGLRVGPHPHIGLQTVTWLLAGEVLHRDSLGSVQTIAPGQLNLMTSGRGIAHSEESPLPRPPDIHGVQLWIALPDAVRHGPAAFQHYPQVPVVSAGGARVTVFAGAAMGVTSPAQVHTPLVGLEIDAPDEGVVNLPLRADFEHGVLVVRGAAQVCGEHLKPGTLLYLGRERDQLQLNLDRGTTLIVIGGQPFAEPLLMWWNFVARSKQELTQACRDWNAGADYFGEVRGYDGARLVAPLPPWAEPEHPQS